MAFAVLGQAAAHAATKAINHAVRFIAVSSTGAKSLARRAFSGCQNRNNLCVRYHRQKEYTANGRSVKKIVWVEWVFCVK
jgi:hypothetical protein